MLPQVQIDDLLWGWDKSIPTLITFLCRHKHFRHEPSVTTERAFSVKVKIVKKVCQESCFLITQNAGYEGAVVVQKVMSV